MFSMWIRRVFGISVLAGLIALVTGCATFMQESAWQKAAEQDTVDAYDAFAVQYPDGKYTPYARARAKVKAIATVEDMKRFLNGRKVDTAEVHVSIPRFEELLVEDIAKNGVGDRFVLTESMLAFPTDAVSFYGSSSASSTTIQMDGRGIPVPTAEFFRDSESYTVLQLFTGGRLLCIPAGDGCVHRYQGEVRLRDFTLVGDGDWSNRLTFAVIEDVGYVFLRGKGRVEMPDGRTISLEGSILKTK